MGLCLLVYNLGQIALHQASVQADESLLNQLAFRSTQLSVYDSQRTECGINR